MFGHKFAESRVATDRRQGDPSLTVAFALAAVVPVAVAFATYPAFAAGALTGVLAGVALRR